ncbi:MAG: hypothetical protein ACK4UZ_13700, partial [Rhizobium rhizophilum]
RKTGGKRLGIDHRQVLRLGPGGRAAFGNIASGLEQSRDGVKTPETKNCNVAGNPPSPDGEGRSAVLE